MRLGTRSLTLTVNGVSRTGDVSDCRIVSGELDKTKWSIGRSIREYRLQGTAAQDPSAGSLWDLVWSNVDQVVEVDLRPAGGTVASSEQPWFSGMVTIVEPDGVLLGGQADPATGNRFVFDFDWPFTDKPIRVVA